MAETALIFGVGPGLGTSLANRFAKAGMKVAITARDINRLEELLPELESTGAPKARAYACDVTVSKFVNKTFQCVTSELGVPRLVVFNTGTYVPKCFLETDQTEFEKCWYTDCLGGFLVGQNTVRTMLTAGPRLDNTFGTLLFTGATASLRGSACFHNVAVGKFGLRALSQSMAREFAPVGIHIAHIIIDGQIRARKNSTLMAGKDNDAKLDPNAIAENYWNLHCQPRSAWTHELDLRSWLEKT